MKFIITNFFEEKFNKSSKDISINDLIKKINLESKSFIGLKIPFFKIKIRSKNKTYRVIVNYEHNLFTLLFINIFDKKDKKFGENINWDLHKNDILKWYESNLNDIRNGNYRKIEK